MAFCGVASGNIGKLSFELIESPSLESRSEQPSVLI
jgi:hypothetical protein